MDTSKIDRMIALLNAQADLAAGRVKPERMDKPQETGGFGSVLKTSLNQVNQTQLAAEKSGKDFEMGVNNVNLSDVMVSIQKANISFQATVQVRNRLVEAYHQIMNMQI